MGERLREKYEFYRVQFKFADFEIVNVLFLRMCDGEI
jgi:hypothetical protein